MHVNKVKNEALQNMFNIKNMGIDSIAENRLGRFGARENLERTSLKSTNLYCKTFELQTYNSGFYGFLSLKYKHFTLWVFTVQITIFVNTRNLRSRGFIYIQSFYRYSHRINIFISIKYKYLNV